MEVTIYTNERMYPRNNVHLIQMFLNTMQNPRIEHIIVNIKRQGHTFYIN